MSGPHEFTGPVVNGERICKWCSGTPRECSLVFGPICNKRSVDEPVPTPVTDTGLALMNAFRAGWDARSKSINEYLINDVIPDVEGAWSDYTKTLS